MNVSVVVSSIVVRLSTEHMSLFGTRNHFYKTTSSDVFVIEGVVRVIKDRGDVHIMHEDNLKTRNQTPEYSLLDHRHQTLLASDISLIEGIEWHCPPAACSCWWIIEINMVLILTLIGHRWSFFTAFKYIWCAVKIVGAWMFYERGCSSVCNRIIFSPSLHGPLSLDFLKLLDTAKQWHGEACKETRFSSGG